MEQQNIKINKDRIRIFLIIYFFSENYSNSSKPSLRRIFESEVKLQKIDFWMRNPDYLSLTLLDIAERDSSEKQEIKKILQLIFKNKEPEIRKEEMERFLYGAWEDIDNAIAFLDSIDLIKFESTKDKDLKIRDKKYYITSLGVEKIETNLPSLPYLQWYQERCLLIKKYFGDKNGTQLKNIQYLVDEYANTPYGQKIPDVSHLVKEKFKNIYLENL